MHFCLLFLSFETKFGAVQLNIANGFGICGTKSLTENIFSKDLATTKVTEILFPLATMASM